MQETLVFRTRLFLRREYHQSFAQPGFRAENKRAISGHFLLISVCLGRKSAGKKTRAQPWYARKSGNIRGFEKGLAGGGWRQTNPQKEPKKFSRNVSPFS